MLYEDKFLLALLITLSIEIPVIVFLVNYFYKYKLKLQQLFLAGIIASSLTLPYLWFVLPAYISDRLIFLLVSEILIVCIEAVIYRQLLKIRLTKSFIISLIANIVSILVGLVLF